jgi:hypothetical protein
MTGLLREKPANPTSSADPAPSMTRLAAPHPTANATNTAAMAWRAMALIPPGLLKPSTSTQTPYMREQAAPSSGFIVVASASARPAPAIAAGLANAPLSNAMVNPSRPSAIEVVCCGVYHSDLGILSIRSPLNGGQPVTASTLMSRSPCNGRPCLSRSIAAYDPSALAASTARQTAVAAALLEVVQLRTRMKSIAIIRTPASMAFALRIA